MTRAWFVRQARGSGARHGAYDDAVVEGVGDEQLVADDGQAGGRRQVFKRRGVGGVRQVREEVDLTEHTTCDMAAFRRNLIPEQDAVLRRGGDEQAVADKRYAVWTVHAWV